MAHNVGGADRIVRIVIGVAGIALPLAGVVPPGIASIISYVVGAIGLGTALISWCPVNAILGVNSCKSAAAKPQGTP
ncbi:MAG: DUF2892 domain-containing protein [Myxococcales bacterium]|nr:DUF2892 domain-containing protein [Myxococcales bacterium]